MPSTTTVILTTFSAELAIWCNSEALLIVDNADNTFARLDKHKTRVNNSCKNHPIRRETLLRLVHEALDGRHESPRRETLLRLVHEALDGRHTRSGNITLCMYCHVNYPTSKSKNKKLYFVTKFVIYAIFWLINNIFSARWKSNNLLGLDKQLWDLMNLMFTSTSSNACSISQRSGWQEYSMQLVTHIHAQ